MAIFLGVSAAQPLLAASDSWQWQMQQRQQQDMMRRQQEDAARRAQQAQQDAWRAQQQRQMQQMQMQRQQQQMQQQQQRQLQQQQQARQQRQLLQQRAAPANQNRAVAPAQRSKLAVLPSVSRPPVNARPLSQAQKQGIRTQLAKLPKQAAANNNTNNIIKGKRQAGTLGNRTTGPPPKRTLTSIFNQAAFQKSRIQLLKLKRELRLRAERRIREARLASAKMLQLSKQNQQALQDVKSLRSRTANGNRRQTSPILAYSRHDSLSKGDLDVEIAKTFRSGSYARIVLQEETELYRVVSDDGDADGKYWSRKKPIGPLGAVMESALDQNWGNRATRVITARVPAGAVVYEGVAAAQRGLTGGGNQVYIDSLEKSWIISDEQIR